MIGVEYNSILVVVDRLIKYIYFILFIETSTVEDLIYIFIKIVVGNYRILDEIILDRDKLFTSKF